MIPRLEGFWELRWPLVADAALVALACAHAVVCGAASARRRRARFAAAAAAAQRATVSNAGSDDSYYAKTQVPGTATDAPKADTVLPLRAGVASTQSSSSSGGSSHTSEGGAPDSSLASSEALGFVPSLSLQHTGKATVGSRVPRKQRQRRRRPLDQFASWHRAGPSTAHTAVLGSPVAEGVLRGATAASALHHGASAATRFSASFNTIDLPRAHAHVMKDDERASAVHAAQQLPTDALQLSATRVDCAQPAALRMHSGNASQPTGTSCGADWLTRTTVVAAVASGLVLWQLAAASVHATALASAYVAGPGAVPAASAAAAYHDLRAPARMLLPARVHTGTSVDADASSDASPAASGAPDECALLGAVSSLTGAHVVPAAEAVSAWRLPQDPTALQRFGDMQVR